MVASTLPVSQDTAVFSAQVSGTEARRQLRMSVGVVVMLAIGIVSAAVSIGAHPIAAKREIMSFVPLTIMHADSNVVGAKAI